MALVYLSWGMKEKICLSLRDGHPNKREERETKMEKERERVSLRKLEKGK